MADENPAPPALSTPDTERLAAEVHALRKEVTKLNNLRFFRLSDNLWKFGAFQFYRGLAFGLGSVLGATLLVSVLVQILSTMDFIPVLGELINRILEQIKVTK